MSDQRAIKAEERRAHAAVVRAEGALEKARREGRDTASYYRRVAAARERARTARAALERTYS